MNPDQKAFLDAFPVSHETIQKLEHYSEMLFSWNEKFNLVAQSTIPLAWTRHFLDSAQLFSLIPATTKTLADMGAGAGFPGLVLAILAQEKSAAFCSYEIESTGKKADFLTAVIKELGLNAEVRHGRIEDIKDLKADVITARALKPLPELLKYANRLANADATCLFLKGKQVDDELTEAKKYWTFSSKIYPSRSDDSGKILELKNLRYKAMGKNFRHR